MVLVDMNHSASVSSLLAPVSLRRDTTKMATRINGEATIATMFNCSPPPPFLATPGPASVPWTQWKQAFLNYLEAFGREELSKILLSALGLEGERDNCSLVPHTPDPSSGKDSAAYPRFKQQQGRQNRWRRCFQARTFSAQQTFLHNGERTDEAAPFSETPTAAGGTHRGLLRCVTPSETHRTSYSPINTSVHIRYSASESAPVDSSHGECDVSVLPSVPEQEDNFGANSSRGKCDVSVRPPVPEQDNFREAQTEDVVVRREPSVRVWKNQTVSDTL
ncbi:hypothetical protein MTO96_032447 [Rhipicephalus appendiculatus]